MKSKIGGALMTIGALMVLSALLLLVHNKNEADQAAKSSFLALEKMQPLIEKNQKGTEEPHKPDQDGEVILPEPVKLETAQIDGYGYIGYLSIPDLGLELPVMDKWDYTRLELAPCRQFGDTAENLVIAGHNYERHFGRLEELKEGAPIRFTDMAGNVSSYEVASVETIGPSDVDKVYGSEWNLVLYTCTYSGKSRVMVGSKIVLW